MLTLGCKELENLFCDADFLHEVFDSKIPLPELRRILHEESDAEDLVSEWRYHIRPLIRDRLPNNYDSARREREAEEGFERLRADPDIRIRLVSGKDLIRRVAKSDQKGILCGVLREPHARSCSDTHTGLGRYR